MTEIREIRFNGYGEKEVEEIKKQGFKITASSWNFKKHIAILVLEYDRETERAERKGTC